MTELDSLSSSIQVVNPATGEIAAVMHENQVHVAKTLADMLARDKGGMWAVIRVSVLHEVGKAKTNGDGLE